MKWFEDSKSVLLKDIFGKEIRIKAVVFDNLGRGDFGVFLADCGDDTISFLTGAKSMMGGIFKIFAYHGIIIEKKMVYDLPESWNIVLMQKRSKDGFFYVDFQGF